VTQTSGEVQASSIVTKMTAIDNSAANLIAFKSTAIFTVPTTAGPITTTTIATTSTTLTTTTTLPVGLQNLKCYYYI
jgi:hypothetical protein